MAMNVFQHQETVCLARLLDRLVKKYDSDVHIILSIINNAFSLPKRIQERHVLKRIDTLKDYRKRLQELKERPHIEQRTQEWYDARKSLITASDFAQALGEGKFGTQKQLFQKKCGYEEEKFNSNLPPLKWGIMFEPVASEIYTIRFDCIMHEFGLLRHPSISHFGASPDGITDNGIMVEIKCPYKRKITGEIPQQYYYQIQGQLEVCNLDECDYLECEFKEVDEETFFNSQSMNERGIIIECNDHVLSQSPRYIYSKIVFDSYDELKGWLENETNGILSSNPNAYITIHYWILSVFNVVRVFRNQEFIDEKLELLKETWNKIEEYKGNYSLYAKEITSSAPKKESKEVVKLTGYSFI